MTGLTNSTDFRLVNAFDTTVGESGDVFVAKFSANGQLVYSSYLGGSAADSFFRTRLDGAGNIYLAGNVASGGFPLANPFDTTVSGSTEGFVMKPATVILYHLYHFIPFIALILHNLNLVLGFIGDWEETTIENI